MCKTDVKQQSLDQIPPADPKLQKNKSAIIAGTYAMASGTAYHLNARKRKKRPAARLGPNIAP
jgi:hypothetical protein